MTDILIKEANGDVVLNAVVKARKMADEQVLNGLTGRQVSSVSDVHIARGEPITVRVNGNLTEFEPEKKITEAEINEFLIAELKLDLKDKDDPFTRRDSDPPRGMSKGAHTWTVDREDTGMLRVHVTKTDQGHALAIRLLPSEPPKLAALGTPPFINKLKKRRKGLSIVAGATGSGKSTLLAAIMESINEEDACVIITIDDAIEFHFKPKKSRFRQIEVGQPGHAPTYAQALTDLLQADPDIVVVSEARDPAALQAAIDFALRGRWCILTTHLDSGPQVADRIVGAFPEGAQPMVRTNLAAVLQDVIVMALPRTKDGKSRVPACEILTRNDGMIQAILKPTEISTEAALKNVIKDGAKEGMQTMEDALYKLVVDKKLVSYEEAMKVAIRPKELADRLATAGVTAESTASSESSDNSGFGSFSKE